MITWTLGFLSALYVAIRERRMWALAAALILAAFAAYVVQAILYGDH